MRVRIVRQSEHPLEMRYAYSAKVRTGYLVPAGAALLIAGVFLAFVATGSVVPTS
jgi:hypothetical protein